MYPPKFNYHRPGTLKEAVELLSRYQDQEAKILAGGQSLIPLLKLRMATPGLLIDINRIEELCTMQERDGFVLFGALVRHAEIQESEWVRLRFPIMYDSASQIGDVQVRNWGTLGGSVAHADPAGDWAPVLIALNAAVGTISARGERTVGIQDLLLDAYSPDLRPDEIVTQIKVPLPAPRSGGAYVKLERRAGDFAVASVAVQLTLDEKSGCREIGIALGAVGSTALRAARAEERLRNQEIVRELIESAAFQAASEADPFSDSRGSADYRRHVVKPLFQRAFDTAWRRARGEQVTTAHL